jgi:filamentous hemagglutinin family protein
MNTFKNSQIIFPDLFKPPGKADPKPPPRRSRLVFGTPRRPGNALVFLVSFMTYLLGIFPSVVYALPSDPTVQAGSATINQPSQDSLVIQQATDKAIIDWRAFGIGSNEHVEFQLPSSSGVTLNRVTGNERSDIFGSLKSNGNLMLINPNGILFGAGSRVDVHGLVATTSNITNENFMSGNYNFNIPSDRGGIIVNRGRITAAQGGLVALVAPGVRNEGIIEARLGRVTLASGNTFTLDLYGDQLVNLGLNSQITEQVTGLDGEVLSSLVSNSGAIYADGGRVRLEVNAARDVVDQVINMSGIIQARTAVEQNGSIVLMGGDEGSVDVSGTLDASGLNEGETGGTIHVFGETIGLFDSALLDTSGYNGGGEILVGGDYQGQGDYLTAMDTFVGEGVSIYNDALWSGDGGRSIFWANRRMRFFGSVYARGGRQRGNGGFIEVSGKEELFFDGWADTSAANGLMGTLLLDPTDIVIADGSGTPSASGAATFTTYENTLEALSGNTDIELLATNSITMNNLSDNLLNLNISGSLTMTAGVGGITFLDTNDKIRSNRAINLTATGGNLTLGSLESSEGNITLKGNDLILGGALSSINGTTKLLSSNSGTIGLGTGTGTFSVNGTELQNITAANLVVGDGTNGNITVDGITSANSNNIAETVTLNATKSSSKVTFANSSTFNALTVNAGNGIATTNATVTADAGNMVLNGGTGSITLNSSLNSTGDTSLSAGTGITLANGVNVSSGGTLSLATTSGDINAQGSVAVSSASGITLNNNFTSNGTTTFDAGTGSFTVANNQTVLTNNNSLSVTGADIVLDGSLNSGTGTTTLLSSNGGTIGLGGTSKDLTLDNGELGRITASNLVVGDATNGDITVDGVTNGGTVTMNATKSTSKVTFANSASTFNDLTVNAGNGIAANAAVTTDAGDLVLNGGTGGITSTGAMTLAATAGSLALNSSLNSTGNANLTAGEGMILANGISVSSTNGTLSLSAGSDINAQGAVAVSSASGITLNDDFTSQGTTTFDADSNDDGSGSFTVASGKTVTTGNNSLSVTGADIDLNATGSLNSGTGTTTLLASKSDTTIGLGDGAGTFKVSGGELENITAGNLVVGDNTNGDITVDNVTAANSANITGTTTLNATKTASKVTFNNDSTFNGLDVNSENGVTVSGNMTTQSSTSFDADSNNDGSGNFTVASGKIVDTGNNSLSITGADVVLDGSLDSGTGTTTLLASKDGTTIGLGATAKDMTVDNGELSRITAGNLTIGDNKNGDITVDGVTATNITSTTTLNATKSTSSVTFTTASSFDGPLSLNAGANATVLTDNALTLASSTVGGTQVITVAGGHGLIVSGNQTVGGTISMTADTDITFTGGLFTTSASGSAVTLTSTSGGIFDGDLTGALDIDAANGGLVANSVTGFGTPGNAIETKVASVDIDSTGTGEINIFETDSLNVVNLNHSGTGDINVSYFGTLTNEVNAIAANGTKTFTNRDSGSLFLPEFGKTLSEVSTDKTVIITNGLESNYFFGNQPSPTQGNTVAQMLSGPETGPFVTNVFDENFELIKVAKRSRRAHSGLRGFSNFWGPLGIPNTELVKRPSRKSLREEAKLKKKRNKKRRSGIKRKARPRLKNARVKPVGDTASLPKIQKQRQKQKRSQKPTKSWLGTQLGNFFK